MVLDGFWLLFCGSWWFLLDFGGSLWFSVVSWQFLVVLKDFLVFFDGSYSVFFCS